MTTKRQLRAAITALIEQDERNLEEIEELAIELAEERIAHPWPDGPVPVSLEATLGQAQAIVARLAVLLDLAAAGGPAPALGSVSA